MSSAMTVQGIYACACVKDFDAAIAFYTRLMGREPDDRPLPNMVQWRKMGGAGLQVWQEADHAGYSLMTIVVPVMSTERHRLEAAGIAFPPEATGDFGGIVRLVDPEGNRIVLAEPPKNYANQ